MKLILVLENDTDQKPDKSRIFVHHRGRRQMIDFFHSIFLVVVSNGFHFIIKIGVNPTKKKRIKSRSFTENVSKAKSK